MSSKIIYHGSSNIIESPELGAGKPNNDYGQGFYCTENIDLAKEWACSESKDGYANKYSIDLSSLSILDLTGKEYNTLNWLAILLENRIFDLSNPLARSAKNYLINNFLPNYNKYDVINGYRADDSYFSFARAFINNQISLKQLAYVMKLGKLGNQIVLKSQKAFDSLSFVNYEIAKSALYYPKKKQRDENARNAFYREFNSPDLNGLYMRDILAQEINNNDPRLF